MPNFRARRENIRKTYPRKTLEIALYSLIAWISVSRPLEPVLGRKFHVESEFQGQNAQFRRPEAKK